MSRKLDRTRVHVTVSASSLDYLQVMAELKQTGMGNIIDELIALQIDPKVDIVASCNQVLNYLNSQEGLKLLAARSSQ